MASLKSCHKILLFTKLICFSQIILSSLKMSPTEEVSPWHFTLFDCSFIFQLCSFQRCAVYPFLEGFCGIKKS